MFAVFRRGHSPHPPASHHPALEVLEDRSLPAAPAPIPLLPSPVAGAAPPGTTQPQPTQSMLLVNSYLAPPGTPQVTSPGSPSSRVNQADLFGATLVFRGPNVAPARLPVLSATAPGATGDSPSTFAVAGNAEQPAEPPPQANPGMRGAASDQTLLERFFGPFTPSRPPAAAPPAKGNAPVPVPRTPPRPAPSSDARPESNLGLAPRILTPLSAVEAPQQPSVSEGDIPEGQNP